MRSLPGSGNRWVAQCKGMYFDSYCLCVFRQQETWRTQYFICCTSVVSGCFPDSNSCSLFLSGLYKDNTRTRPQRDQAEIKVMLGEIEKEEQMYAGKMNKLLFLLFLFFSKQTLYKGMRNGSVHCFLHSLFILCVWVEL